MSANMALGEVVVFELPHPLGPERLCERLRHRWHVWIGEGDETSLVAVELRPREDDLAVLLRAVKLWLADFAIDEIRFRLDGRAYALESGTAIVPAAALESG